MRSIREAGSMLATLRDTAFTDAIINGGHKRRLWRLHIICKPEDTGDRAVRLGGIAELKALARQRRLVALSPRIIAARQRRLVALSPRIIAALWRWGGFTWRGVAQDVFRTIETRVASVLLRRC
jgi:hypothetical protein